MWYFPTLLKQMFLASDETKHMLLFIFHVLYTCLTVEVLHEMSRKTIHGSNVSTT